MSGHLSIDRCVCFDRRFSEILESIRREPAVFGCSEGDGGVLPEDACAEAALAEIRKRFGCGGSCGVCRPYIVESLRTGRTEFDEIIVDSPRTHG